MKCKIRITKGLEGVWSEYQPIVGEIYDADYDHGRECKPATAVIIVNGKKIIVRKNEFELAED